MLIGRHSIDIEGLTDEIGVRSYNQTYIMPGSEIAKYLIYCYDIVNNDKTVHNINMCYYIYNIYFALLNERGGDGDPVSFIRYYEKRYDPDDQISKLKPIFEYDKFLEIMSNTSSKLFDPSAWIRHTNE